MTAQDHLRIQKARRFAINCHKDVNQLYDGLPYHTHLAEVAEYAVKFGYLLPEKDRVLAICAAWCHDLLEYCNITYNDLKMETDVEIADVVFLLTNHRGKTRKDRANEDYYHGIREDYIALFDKLCDRMGNMTHSLLYDNTEMHIMYVKELPHFKEKLYNGLYDDMWTFLENLNKKDFLNNHYFPTVDVFDKDNLCKIKLPKPIPYALYNELYNKGIIRKKNLKKNHYYYGECRNANVALWNGFEFIYVRCKFGTCFNETIKHLEDDNGYDLFIPLYEMKIEDVEEGDRIKY